MLGCLEPHVLFSLADSSYPGRSTFVEYAGPISVGNAHGVKALEQSPQHVLPRGIKQNHMPA